MAEQQFQTLKNCKSRTKEMENSQAGKAISKQCLICEPNADVPNSCHRYRATNVLFSCGHLSAIIKNTEKVQSFTSAAHLGTCN